MTEEITKTEEISLVPPAPAPPENAPPIPLMLQYYQGLGDCIASTTAVQCISTQYPGRFAIDVMGPGAEEVFANSPWRTRLPRFEENGEEKVKALFIRMENPLVQHANVAPINYVHSYCYVLSQALGIPVAATVRYPQLFFTEAEQQTVPDCLKDVGPVWAINAGAKDYTVKRWDKWQKVVDHFRNRLTFVQVGGAEHGHTPLDGVINMIGKTSIRELLCLMLHCQGSVGPESAHHHIAAAMRKPAVVLCSGSWPLHFFAYPQARYVSRLGQMTCCSEHSCGRLRVLPLGDGKDADKHTCLFPVIRPDGPAIPKCVSDISAWEIIREIEGYYYGDVLKK